MITRKMILAAALIALFAACNTTPTEQPKPEPASEVTAPAETGFDTAAMTAAIDARRAAIEANLDNYQKVEIGKEKLREKTRQKWEKIHFYLEDGAIVRIKSYPYAEISKRTEEFYFDNGNLALAVIEDNGEADAAKGHEAVDKLIYFHDGEAFSEVSKGDEQEFSTLKAEGETLLAEANEYFELLKKNQ